MAKKRKEYDVDVQVLEKANDDLYLVRYHVRDMQMMATEWVSFTGAKQWLETVRNTATITHAIMKAIKEAIEKHETQKEVQNDGSEINPDR